jgi:hypothetical protein
LRELLRRRAKSGHGYGTCNTRLRFTKANRQEQRGVRRSNLSRSDKRSGWCATTRVPLHFAAIPEDEIAEAREFCGLSLETWRRQEQAFGLLRKVYEKRAVIRGQQPPTENYFPSAPAQRASDNGCGY